MDSIQTKQELEHKLARCARLAEEFREGSTAEMIRDMEAELREQIASFADEWNHIGTRRCHVTVDIKNGHRVVDQKGHECENDEAALEKARVIAIGVSLDNPEVDPKRHVAVINDDGEEIHRVPVYSTPVAKA